MQRSCHQAALDLFVDRVSSHSVLNEEERAALRGLPYTPHDVRAHVDFVRLGETVGHASLVAQGLISRFGETEDGRRQIVSVHLPGEMIDLCTVMVTQSAIAVMALANTTVLRIPHDRLRDVCARFPGIVAAFWRDCIIDAHILAQWLVNIGRRDARARRAHFLCELAIRSQARVDSEGLTYRLPVSQEQLGDVLGLTSVHVNRMLMALRSDGIVRVERGQVRILDWNGLVMAADFDPSYIGTLGAPDPISWQAAMMSGTAR